jgi:glutamyl-tRNA synthetase
MAHVPDVLGADGKKLSKRHGATAVAEFGREGYLPEGLINYLVFIGWSPGTEEEIFSMDDLIRVWKIEQVQSAPGKWDKDRLDYFNGVWIRRLSSDELVRRLEPFVPAEWDRAILRRIAPHIQERIKTLKDAKDQIAFLFTDELSYDPRVLVPKKQDPARTVEVLAKATVHLRYLEPFNAERIEHALAAVAQEAGWKQGEVNMSVRVAVTGRTVGPPLYQSVEILGRERALQRVDAAIDALSKANS